MPRRAALTQRDYRILEAIEAFRKGWKGKSPTVQAVSKAVGFYADARIRELHGMGLVTVIPPKMETRVYDGAVKNYTIRSATVFLTGTGRDILAMGDI